jgi:hypothetical protein
MNHDACLLEARRDGRPTVESARYRVTFRTRPEQIVVGEHFTLELLVCPRGETPRPDTVRVDAEMPEHRHGMNYRTTVTAEGDSRYRADGLLFHMPGHWVFIVDVRAAGQTDRLTQSIRLE